LARTAAHAGLTQESAQAHAVAFEDWHQADLIGDLSAPNLPDAVEERDVARRSEDLAAIFA
jgi:hypothetical protein